MEELRTSRRPAAKKSSYGDVFGGAPKYSASSDEYAEIFGGIATSSCSIPFLDLPPVSDGSDGGFVDYSEIFGGFHGGGDFAVDYEELFGTQRKKEVGGSPSSNGRTSIEVKFRQQDGEVQHLPQVGAAQDYEVYPLKNTLSSSSNHFDDVSKQFNMSFHRTNLGSMDDAMSGKMHTTQLHAIPGYSYVVDTFSSIQDVRTDNFPNIETNCPIQTASNGQANHFDDTKSNEAALKTNQKEPNSQFTTTENAPLNMKHHSRSSSNYSSSSGDISNPDITYVGVSDISLRTQPCKVPPPSRAPPKLVSKQENSKTRVYEEGNFLKPKLDHQIHYRVGDAKSHRLQGVAKDTSAAAAAMKEAMEQAQARLKTAKELMERKRDNLQSRKKLSQKEGTKYGERKEVKAFEEDKIFDNEIFEKPLIKEDISKKGYALDDRNGDRSSQLPDKSEEVSGEWKMDTQFYELVNNDSKFKVIKEASKQEDVERKIKESCVIEDNKSYPEQAEKLHMDKEIFESDDDNIKADNMTCKEEITEMLNTNHGNVNKFEEAYSSHLENRTEKLQSDHEAQNPIFVEEALVYREGEKDEESSNNAFKDDKISHDDEEACQFDYREKLSRPSVTSVSYEIEKKPEILLRKDVQDETQIEVNFTSTKCELEEEEEVVAVECQLEEDECELEETALASKHEESGNLDGAQGDCMEGKDELKSKVALDAYVVKENTEELKPPLATIEKEIKSANENPDCNEIETSEAQPEVQKNNMNQNADEKTSTELESTIKPRDLQGDNIESEDDGLKQGDKVENSIPDTQNTEEMENEIKRDRKHEKEQARKAEEEREREREREKDRLAVERATRQAHERALNEARERAERIAVERVTAEARQRALAEAREKAERASAAALEKALAEKALKEAKIRAERAAVERATAEARERAVEKALAEKAAADARQRAERFSAISRDKGRKENEVKAGDKDDREVKLNVSSSDVLRDVRFQNGGDVDSPLRCKARLERHQRTVERAAKALAEKNMRDILAQREQAERNRLAESLDADVRRWATGKEGNLRALLSTLQYILGPENGWQPIPLTDVITAAAAKKAYRKATLCVHPDKLQQRGATIQQKYICEKVFDLLKDAWNRFNSEER